MQKKSFPTKVALVTGAARRIGAAIACALHNSGMNVVLHYHTSVKEAEVLCQALNQKRERSAITIHADLNEIKNGETLIQQAAGTWQRLDVLVNNASQFYRTTMGEVTEQAWNDLLGSNLKAPFFLAQAAAPFLTAHQGVIINIADIHGKSPLRHHAVYSIAKSGLIMLTYALAKELAPLVRVNAIAPGAILWPESKNNLLETEKQKIIHRTLLQRPGNPEDIAKAVLFFVYDAGYITGQVLNVDGGRRLG